MGRKEEVIENRTTRVAVDPFGGIVGETVYCIEMTVGVGMVADSVAIEICPFRLRGGIELHRIQHQEWKDQEHALSGKVVRNQSNNHARKCQ